MRLVVALGLLGACYQPHLEDACAVHCEEGGSCPNGSSCFGTRCIPDHGDCGGYDDAFHDAPPPDDGPRSGLCTPHSLTAQNVPVASGSDFSVNATRTRAAVRKFDALTGFWRVFVAEGANVDVTPGFSVVLIPETNQVIESPNMAPDGTVIFMRIIDDLSSIGHVYEIDRTAPGSWTNPLKLQLDDMSNTTLDVDDYAPGQPTLSPPRRMPMSNSNSGFDEFEEDLSKPNTWKLVQHVDKSVLGVANIRDPSFTADGRRVVFSGPNGAGIQIYYAERDDVGAAWHTALPLFDDPTVTETAPTYSTDCTRLYYTNMTSDLIVRAQ